MKNANYLLVTTLTFIIAFFNTLAITAQQVLPQPQESTNNDSDELVDEDKAELVRLALEMALVEKQIPDYNMIEKQEQFLLSMENIKSEFVPELKGIKLVLLEPKEIQEKANKKGSFVYYFHFNKFEVKNSKVLVYLDNIPLYAESFAQRFLIGGGFTLEFQKKDGKWFGMMRSSWIS